MKKNNTLVFLVMLLLSCSEKKNTETARPVLATGFPKPAIFEEGIISTGDYEAHPAFSPSGDTLYFIKCTADLGMSTICVSYKRNGKWTNPEVASFSGKFLDVDPFVTKDGNTLYFSSNRPVSEGGSIKPDWDIWKVELVNNSWGKPVHLDSAVNSNEDEYYPTISDNGTLYFGSARINGKGGSDIYFAKSVNGNYSTVENAGDSVNTSNNEYEPFIARDESYLIFMATNPGGLVHADLYLSYNRKGKWSKPVKLPAPVNSEATEWSPKVTRDDNYFFFGSTRNKNAGQVPGTESIEKLEKRVNSAGNGLSDIYIVDLSALQIRR
ncbi:MAG: PD40 domain-containing protein [Sphingobacteriales bacterium]|nr:PD40 domain-containing protein [Sphingobacteriales bacterium]